MTDVPLPIRGRTLGAGWKQLTYGVHVHVDADTRGDLAGWQLLLPAHGSFTHLTGAGLRGWWLPPLPMSMPVLVSMGQRDPRPMRSGIRTIRLARPSEFEVIDGLRVAAPLEILLACAHDLGLVDLVVLLDGAAFAGDIDLDEVRAVLHGLSRRRGLAALRRALELADARSESPWETMLRLLLVSCGIEVEPQYVVPGRHGPIARADLWVVGTRTLQELDGEVHLPKTQQRKDLRRMRRLGEEDWARHGYTSDDVLHRAVRVLADADRAVGREHEPERIRLWHDLLRASLFTPAGRARLAARLGLAGSA